MTLAFLCLDLSCLHFFYADELVGGENGPKISQKPLATPASDVPQKRASRQDGTVPGLDKLSTGHRPSASLEHLSPDTARWCCLPNHPGPALCVLSQAQLSWLSPCGQH